MRKLFERIVDFMEENGSIQSEYRDVYLFALQTIAVYAFNIGTGVVIGAAFGELLYCMIFLIAFMLLRQEAGGYHAPGWMSCYFLSCGILVLTLLWIKAEFAYQTCLTIAAALAAGMGIFLFAPLEDKNKPLEEAEKKVIGKKGANHSCNRADTRNGILSGKSESCICGFGRSYLVWSELSGMVSKKIYGEKWEK